MSTIKKLTIQGIRSFDPDGQIGNVIQFFTPMTLIVGQNGCGKTTIIEALKYAITAEYPPGTSKGQTFVNDPKLSDGYEVLGYVRLEILSGNEDRVVVTRRLKATVKGKLGNLSVTTVEGTILVQKPDGTKAQLSNKCFDLKAEMCRIMGVSEPILNNVLFCHQEDSCWPLDEGKKVKEKFDAIFNTTMYIKCLDQLIKKEKDIAIKIKVETEGLKYAKDMRQIATQKRRELENKNVQLHKANDDKTEYETQLSDLEKKLKELEDLEREYTKIVSKVQEKKGSMDSIKTQIEELRETIKEHFEGDIGSLQSKLQNFKSQSSQKLQSIRSKEKELNAINSQLNRLNEMKSKLLVKQGQFQQEEVLNNKRLETAKMHIHKVVSMIKRLRETSQDATFSNAMEQLVNMDSSECESLELESAIKALAGAIQTKESEYNRVQNDFEIREKDFQKIVDELRTQKASLETEIEIKGKQMDDNKSSISLLKKRLIDIEGCNEKLAFLDDEETAFAEQIQGIESSGIIGKCDGEIETLNAEIKDFERKINTLNGDIKLLTEDKSKLEQIAIFNRQKQEKQSACKLILRKREDGLAVVLGEVPEDGISKLLDEKLKNLKAEINQNEKDLKTKERKCIGFESDLKRIKESLANKEKLIEDIKMRQIDLLEGEDLDETLAEVFEQVEARQKDSYYAEAAQFLFKKNIQRLRNKPFCPLCKRSIETKEQVSKLVQEIERDVEKMIEKQPQDYKAIEDLKEKQRKLQEQKPDWDLLKSLESKELPELRKKVLELEPLVQELKDDIENVNETITLLKSDYSTGSECTNDLAIYEQNLKEVKKQDDNINNVERSRNVKAKGMTSSLSDAQNKLKDMEGTFKAKKVEKDNKDDLRNQKRNELAELQHQKNKAQAEKLNITQEMQNREALEKQKRDLEEKNRKLQDSVTESNRKLPTFRSNIKKAESNKESVTKEKEEKLKAVYSDQESLINQKKELTKLNSEIVEFGKAKIKFIETQRQADDCNSELEEYERKKEELSGQIDVLKDDVSSRETKQRDLLDNLSLKEKEIQVEKLKVEMEDQEKLLAETSNQGVTAKKREYARQHHKLSADLNKLIGRRQEILQSVTTLKKELGDRPYLTAEEDYKSKLITKVVYEKARKDVIKYKTALDHAILTFHSKRMQQINKLLRELWRTIYKGNDIDYIQIKTENSDEDGPKAQAKVEVGKSSRRTYNYRVVQIRRGIEMDLRGRCSAGQKVLASLIIRMALADSFSSKCGIMTLDEPTTNLDQKNINSLAETLSNIAILKSKVKTFQLIVITHDQDFIDRLLAVDPVENYYQVSRNERGFSNITKKSKQRDYM